MINRGYMIRKIFFLQLNVLVCLAALGMDNKWHLVRELGIDEYGSYPDRPKKPPLVEEIPDPGPFLCRYCSEPFPSDAQVNQHIIDDHHRIPGEKILQTYTLQRPLARSDNQNYQADNDDDDDEQYYRYFRGSSKRRKLNTSGHNYNTFTPIHDTAHDDDDNSAAEDNDGYQAEDDDDDDDDDGN